MLPRFISTLVKVAVASLIVGTILDHFGLSAGGAPKEICLTPQRPPELLGDAILYHVCLSAVVLLKEIALTPERLAELARHGLAWALPNVLLGALIIVPIWFVAYLFRPPGQHSD